MTTVSEGRLLVVDDDPISRRLLAANLQRQGYTVQTAEDGQRALNLLRAQAFDVVLLDLVMPKLDGYQVLERMKVDDALRHIPIIVISGTEDVSNVVRCIEMGAADYLTKPFDPVLLRARVHASLADKRLRDAEQTHLRAIQAISARLQAIIQGAAIGIVVLDLDGRIAESNPALIRMLGRCESDLKGSPLAGFLHPEDAATHGRLYAAAIAGERDQYQCEARLQRCDGQSMYGNLTVSIVRDEQGRPQFGVAMIEDVTARRAAEQTREELTHTIVHDLRSPLTTITTSLELLQSGLLGDLSSRQAEVVQLAQSGAQRMLQMIDTILDVSRLEAGQMPLQRIALELSDLVADVVRLQGPLADDKQVRLASDLPVTLPLVWADVNIIERVLQNLVGNAIKFTPAGGVVCVSARLAEGDPSKVLVSVSDTGPGIPPELKGRLFTKFATGQQRGRGTGLGLAFCKLALEAHGETIWADSTYGQGATFTFSLPLAPPAEG